MIMIRPRNLETVPNVIMMFNSGKGCLKSSLASRLSESFQLPGIYAEITCVGPLCASCFGFAYHLLSNQLYLGSNIKIR